MKDRQEVSDHCSQPLGTATRVNQGVPLVTNVQTEESSGADLALASILCFSFYIVGFDWLHY